MPIPERLREERKRLGWSQTRLGELVGAGKTTVINWEKGSGAPDAMQLAAIAEEGADVQYIVTGVRSVAVLSADEHELLGLFRAAPLVVKASAVAGLKAGADSAAGSKYALHFNAPVGQQINSPAAGSKMVNKQTIKKNDR